MKRRLAISMLLVCVLWTISFAQSGCPCGETMGTKHVRMAMKDRPVPANVSSAKAITIAAMIAWKIPSKTFEEEPAQPYAKETSLYTVTGYAQVVKISDEDCDVHIELSPTKNSASAKRIIAEIPNTTEYCTERADFLKALQDNFGFSKSPKPGYAKKFSKKSGYPAVTVTGYGFWDTAHWSKKHVDNKKGHNHGSRFVATMWEIHPVVKIEVH